MQLRLTKSTILSGCYCVILLILHSYSLIITLLVLFLLFLSLPFSIIPISLQSNSIVLVPYVQPSNLVMSLCRLQQEHESVVEACAETDSVLCVEPSANNET